MPEGPFGGPRPFIESRCVINLLVPITITDENIKNPRREIIKFASENFPVAERNIFIDKPDVASFDFQLILEQREREPAEEMGKVAKRIREQINDTNWMKTNFVNIHCGDPQEIMQASSLPENIRNFFGRE